VVPQTPLHKGKEKNATLKWVNTTYVSLSVHFYRWS
jgi:hypothetical protein